MASAHELLEDARALARALELISSPDSLGIAAALTAGLDAVAADWQRGRERTGRAHDKQSEILAMVVTDLSALLRSENEPQRTGLIRVHRRITDLLAASSLRTQVGHRGAAATGATIEEDRAPTVGALSGKAGRREAALARSERELESALRLYEKDLMRQTRLIQALYATALITTVAATAMAWSLLLHAGNDTTTGRALAELTPEFSLFAFAALLVRQATQARRNADELRRLRRQLTALPAYLRPLPPDTQDLLRAAMTQRLFPRTSDDDPLQEDDWFPDDETLLPSINLKLYEQVLDAREIDEGTNATAGSDKPNTT